jgi:hypothetical protein
MARTRERIAEMRVGGGRRMLMAWSRSEAEDEVAERRRRYGSACKRQRRVGPHSTGLVFAPETCLTS